MLFLAALALHVAPVSPAAPNRQPQLAASGNTIAMVFGSGNTVWFSRSADNGQTFAKPSKIGDLPKLALGRHRGPRVAIAGNNIVVAAISTDLYAWRSTDGGRTWSPPQVVSDVPKAADEGLHALAADAEGNVAIVWLDHRDGQGTRLYGTFSSDGGATWSKNSEVYRSPERTICECCHPSLMGLGNGEFAMMWRNVIDGSRDFYALRIRGGKPVTAAVKQGDGTWKLNACPMDGGGIVVVGNTTYSAWRREKEIFLAESGKPERKLGPGQDVTLAAGAKGPFAIWSEGPAIQAMTPGRSASVRLSETGAFPNAVALPDGSVLAVWEENSGIAARRLP